MKKLASIMMVLSLITVPFPAWAAKEMPKAASVSKAIEKMPMHDHGMMMDHGTMDPAMMGEGMMDPAMMEQMKQRTAPNEAHDVLKAFEGRWTYTGSFRMTPDAPAQPMSGKQENEMIFGGRFLKQEIEGPWMGETFQGLGYTGYDNIRKVYVSTWIDSMATGIMTASGQYDAATQTLHQAGENSCPLTGESHRKGRSEWTVQDADHTTYASYSHAPDGTEFKMMEINYTRAV